MFVINMVDQLDLSKLMRRYSGKDSSTYHPAMMLAGYTNSTCSRRKIERATYNSMAFRFIAANYHSDQDTRLIFASRLLASSYINKVA